MSKGNGTTRSGSSAAPKGLSGTDNTLKARATELLGSWKWEGHLKEEYYSVIDELGKVDSEIKSLKSEYDNAKKKADELKGEMDKLDKEAREERSFMIGALNNPYNIYPRTRALYMQRADEAAKRYEDARDAYKNARLEVQKASTAVYRALKKKFS